MDITASALVSYGDPETFRKFREELGNNDDDALELAQQLADTLPNNHEKSITQTMLRSIRNLGAEGQDFLRLASTLAVAPIPGRLVTSIFERVDGLGQGAAEQRQRKAFHQVTIASLAEISGDMGDARTVHTLVSRAMRFHGRPRGLVRRALARITITRTETLRRGTIDAMLAHFKEMDFRDIFPHVGEFFKRLTRDDILNLLSEIMGSDHKPSDMLLAMHLQAYIDGGELRMYDQNIPRLLEFIRKRRL